MGNSEIILNRDCKATLIPIGHEVLLSEGTSVHIAQALGGNITVRNNMGLYRIENVDLDALGEGFVKQINLENAKDKSDITFSEESIWQALKTCYDPEIPVNIVDLGLIYDIAIDENEHEVTITHTLTSAFCPFADEIVNDIQKAGYVPDVISVIVNTVFDPPFSIEMVPEETRLMMGW